MSIAAVSTNPAPPVPGVGSLATAGHPLLQAARQAAAAAGLPYAGGIAPAQAWALVSAGLETVVDVRSAEERKFVGQVPDSVFWSASNVPSLGQNEVMPGLCHPFSSPPCGGSPRCLRAAPHARSPWRVVPGRQPPWDA
jgi:hypothetical protein